MNLENKSAFDDINWDAFLTPDDCVLNDIEDDDVQASIIFQDLMNSDNDFKIKDGNFIGDFNTLKDAVIKVESDYQATQGKKIHLIECVSCTFEGIKSFNVRFTAEYCDEKVMDIKLLLLEYLSSLGYDVSHILKEPYTYSFNDEMNIVFDYKIEIDFEKKIISYEIKTNNPDYII